VTLILVSHVSCDRPRCGDVVRDLAGLLDAVHAALRARGWTIVRWRDAAARGGPGYLIHLCPEHGDWRPSRGVQLEALLP
jgi:hypothetical protein